MTADEPPTPPLARDQRSFGHDVLITVGGKIAFVICGALLTVLIARELGPSGQGTFAVAFSLTLLLVQVGSIGLSIANPYFSAREPAAQRAIVVHSLWLALLVASGLVLASAGVRALAPGVLRGLGWAETIVTLSALPAALATLYLQGVLLGQQRMPWFSLVEVTQVALPLLTLGVLFATGAPGLTTVLFVLAAGRYIALLIALVALRAVFRGPAPPQPGLVGRMLRHATRVYVVSLISFALIRIDLMLVNALLTSEDAGQYSIATYITEALIVIPSVVATNLLPRVARTDGTEITAAVMRGVLLLWGLICALSLPAAVVGIPLVYGDRYEDAVALYLWLAGGTFALGMVSALMVHYWARGYPSSLIAIWLVALVLNIAGNVVLLPKVGVVAAPVLSTATYVFVLIAHVVVFAREAGGISVLLPRPRETARLFVSSFRRA